FFLHAAQLARAVFVVANSPPLQKPNAAGLLKATLRDRGCDAGYIVYYHGSIGPGKGLLPVVRSMPFWPADSVLVLIGVIYDSTFFEDLMLAAEKSGVRTRVHYFGVVPFPELYRYTASADLGLYVPETATTIHVYSGAAVVKLNDYMACGVPFVVSEI